MAHPSTADFLAWQAELQALPHFHGGLANLCSALSNDARCLDAQLAEDSVRGSADSLGLLNGGIRLQRALLSANLAMGGNPAAPAAEAQRWLVWHVTRYWTAALAETFLGVESAPPMQRHALQATLGRLAAGHPVAVAELSDAAARVARAMAEHARRVVLQTAHSRERRDAQKLATNLTAFVGRLPDPDGIIQRILADLPQKGATPLNIAAANMHDPASGRLMVDPVACADGVTRCRFGIIDRAMAASSSTPPAICCDDVALRNLLFSRYPQQQQAYDNRRLALCNAVHTSFKAHSFQQGRTQAVFAEQMLRHSGERAKEAVVASKRAFIERKMNWSPAPSVVIASNVYAVKPPMYQAPPKLEASPGAPISYTDQPPSATKACCVIQ